MGTTRAGKTRATAAAGRARAPSALRNAVLQQRVGCVGRNGCVAAGRQRRDGWPCLPAWSTAGGAPSRQLPSRLRPARASSPLPPPSPGRPQTPRRLPPLLPALRPGGPAQRPAQAGGSLGTGWRTSQHSVLSRSELVATCFRRSAAECGAAHRARLHAAGRTPVSRWSSLHQNAGGWMQARAPAPARLAGLSSPAGHVRPCPTGAATTWRVCRRHRLLGQLEAPPAEAAACDALPTACGGTQGAAGLCTAGRGSAPAPLRASAAPRPASWRPPRQLPRQLPGRPRPRRRRRASWARACACRTPPSSSRAPPRPLRRAPGLRAERLTTAAEVPHLAQRVLRAWAPERRGRAARSLASAITGRPCTP